MHLNNKISLLKLILKTTSYKLSLFNLMLTKQYFISDKIYMAHGHFIITFGRIYIYI